MKIIKKFKWPTAQLQPLALGFGGCFATDRIVVDGQPVLFMYRDVPDVPGDSGWRFTSGEEPDDYMRNPDNLGYYDVNMIANYDTDIIEFLTYPVGTAFERANAREEFRLSDFIPPEEETNEDDLDPLDLG